MPKSLDTVNPQATANRGTKMRIMAAAAEVRYANERDIGTE